MQKTLIFTCLLATPLLHGMKSDANANDTWWDLIQQEIEQEAVQQAKQKAEQTTQLIIALTQHVIEKRDPRDLRDLRKPEWIACDLQEGYKLLTTGNIPGCAYDSRAWNDSYGPIREFIRLYLSINGPERYPIVVAPNCPLMLRSLLEGTYLISNGHSLRVDTSAGIDQSFGFLRYAPWYRDVTHLDLRATGLTALPEAVGCLSSLTSLNISCNGVRWLGNLECLKRLKRLDAEGNQLWDIRPESIAGLPLTDLNFNCNQFCIFPAELLRLASLRGLSLLGNRISELPDGLAQLTSLDELDVSANNLSSLPACLGSLVCLLKLSARGNQITTVASEIGQLPKLRRLFLDQNNITVLPDCVASNIRGASRSFAVQRDRSWGKQSCRNRFNAPCTWELCVSGWQSGYRKSTIRNSTHLRDMHLPSFLHEW